MDPKVATLLKSLMDGVSQSTGETRLRTPTLMRIAEATGFIGSSVRNQGFHGAPRHNWSITVEGMKAILAAELAGDVEATPLETLRKRADLYWLWSRDEGRGAAVYAQMSGRCTFAGDRLRCASMGQAIDEHVERVALDHTGPTPG